MYIESNRNKLQIFSGYIDSDYLYASFSDFNNVCKVNLYTGRVEISSVYEDFNSDRTDLYRVEGYGNDQIILLPHRGTILYFLNKNLDVCKKYQIKGNCNVNYNRAHIYENKLYLLPVFRPDIACFDIEKGELSYYELPIDDIGDKYARDKEFAVTSSFALNSKIYLLCSNPDMLVEFDCIEKKYTFFRNLNKWMSMCYGGGYYWIGTEKESILRYENDTFKNGEKIPVPSGYLSSGVMPLSGCRYVGGKAIFFSYHANMVLRVDVKSGYCDALRLPKEDFVSSNINQRCGSSFMGVDGSNLWMFSPCHTELLKCDVEKNRYTRLPLLFDKDEMQKLKRVSDTEEYVECNLDSFLKII